VTEGLTAEQLPAKARKLHPVPPRSKGRPAQPRTFKKPAATQLAGRQVDAKRLVDEVANDTPGQRNAAAARAQEWVELAQAVLEALAAVEERTAPGILLQ